MNHYDFGHSDVEQIKNEIAKRLKLKAGKIVFDGKKLIITLKGEPGKTPKKGVDYDDGEPGKTPQKGEDYFDGEAGKPPAHQWDGTKIRFQNPDKTWGQWVDLKGKGGDEGYTPVKGVDYRDGEDGETPVKGVDYKDGEPGKTPKKHADYFDGKPGKPPGHEWDGTKLRFQNPDGTWGPWVDLKGKGGDKGYTPKKGVDYDDGEPGKTPVKGEDYRDGEDAKLPESVTMTVITDVKLIDGNLSVKRQDVKFYKD